MRISLKLPNSSTSMPKSRQLVVKKSESQCGSEIGAERRTGMEMLGLQLNLLLSLVKNCTVAL